MIFGLRSTLFSYILFRISDSFAESSCYRWAWQVWGLWVLPSFSWSRSRIASIRESSSYFSNLAIILFLSSASSADSWLRIIAYPAICFFIYWSSLRQEFTRVSFRVSCYRRMVQPSHSTSSNSSLAMSRFPVCLFYLEAFFCSLSIRMTCYSYICRISSFSPGLSM